MKNSATMIITALFFTGCVSMYADPATREMRNKQMSNYGLCEKLTIATLAPTVIREEWAKELESRGEDCSKHAATLKNVLIRENELSKSERRNYFEHFPLPGTGRQVNTSCSQIGGFVNCTSQ